MIWTIVAIVLIGILTGLFFRNLLHSWILSIKLKKIPSWISPNSLLNIVSVLLAILSVAFTIDVSLIESINTHFTNNGQMYLIIFLITLVITFYNMNIKADKIQYLEKQLDSETKKLWENYAELNEFYRQKSLFNAMEIFINSTPTVVSIQRYKYRILKNHKFLKIIINGDHTTVREGDDLNLVSQAYFEFNLEEINAIISAYLKATVSFKTYNEKDDDIEELEDIYLKLLKELDNLPIEKINNSYTYKFELVKLLHPLLEKSMNVNFDIELSQEKIQKLNGRKSGIDIAMFLLKDYMSIKSSLDLFNYKGTSDSKKARMYSNLQLTNNLGENFVYVIAHQTDDNWTQDKVIQKIEEDTKKFLEIIDAEVHFIS
ncbi:hypothetical protein BFM98_14020 [Lysinibacillus sp. AR18-8]|uniref:hypothetical protein n=1 Tax=Lysinibacillus sp. AR18-8 TaxID=1889781 RepID=UPI0008247BEA|nr:hypothetical protein [Lysinibacillus sp. AR18-8]OCX63324.1 hypothetical protein BFM98_14020 [Lysinibacillus sp. AR18-8]